MGTVPRQPDPAGWKKVAQWRDDLARAANGKGKYSDDYRQFAKIHQKQRAQLIEKIKSGGQDPQEVAARELAWLEKLRRTKDREKGGVFPSK